MSKEESGKSFQWSTTNQYFATIAANILLLAHGCVIGWPSPALPVLSSENSPILSGPLSSEEISWISSINCFGGLTGSLLCGYVIPLIGSKRTLLLTSIPSAIYWIMIYFGITFYHIFAARFISGIAGGVMHSSGMLYISEIANDDIRGRLGSFWQFMRNVGILFMYVIGSIVDYKYLPLIFVFLPILFFVVFVMLPNTPQYLLQNGRIQEAENALKYYKSYKGLSAEEDEAFYKEFERLKSIATERKTEEKLQASDFFNRCALKGLGIGIVLTGLSIVNAHCTLITYAVMIFERSGSPIDPYLSSIILAIALILGSLLTTTMADTFGRKTLNVISLVGSAIGLFAMSFYYYLHINDYDLSAFAWVPVVSLSFVIFISSAGIIPLSFVCSVEYLPSKVRVIGLAIIGVTVSLAVFFSVKLYSPLLEVVDLHGYMFIFGVGSALGAIFVIVVVDETRGTCLDDIGADDKGKVQIVRSRLNSLY